MRKAQEGAATHELAFKSKSTTCFGYWLLKLDQAKWVVVRVKISFAAQRHATPQPIPPFPSMYLERQSHRLEALSHPHRELPACLQNVFPPFPPPFSPSPNSQISDFFVPAHQTPACVGTGAGAEAAGRLLGLLLPVGVCGCAEGLAGGRPEFLCCWCCWWCCSVSCALLSSVLPISIACSTCRLGVSVCERGGSGLCVC